MEVQRRYLGGDSEHSILVKGLDHSLLEQNKARAALSSEDDNALEQAFMEATSHTPTNVPKKRTREELIRHLKEQRARNTDQGPKIGDEEARLLEEAKQKGKFKPIGFKPIGSTSEAKKKKEKRSEDDMERKKKKRKVDVEILADKAASLKDKSSMPPPPVPTKTPKVPDTEEPIDDDFNIFADAGEYEGINVDDDDDDENVAQVARETEKRYDPTPAQRWIPTDEIEPLHTKPPIPPLSDTTTRSPPSSHKVVSEDESEDEQPMRLVPLSSSALPSIKDFLAMDQAAGSSDKKRKRKNKKKAGAKDDDDDDIDEGPKQKSVQTKVDRDYKRSIPLLFSIRIRFTNAFRLKSYTDKKNAVGSK